MQVGTLRLSLFLRQARSLKDKRSVIKSLKDRLRARFNVSVAEIEHQDVIQTACLAVAIVGSDRRHLQSSLDKIINLARGFPGAEMTGCEQEIFCE